MKILDTLVADVLPSTVKFLVAECQTALLTDIGGAAARANQVRTLFVLQDLRSTGYFYPSSTAYATNE